MHRNDGISKQGAAIAADKRAQLRFCGRSMAEVRVRHSSCPPGYKKNPGLVVFFFRWIDASTRKSLTRLIVVMQKKTIARNKCFTRCASN